MRVRLPTGFVARSFRRTKIRHVKMRYRLRSSGAFRRSSRLVPRGKTISRPRVAMTQMAPAPAPAKLPMPRPSSAWRAPIPARVPISAPVTVVRATRPASFPFELAPLIFDSCGLKPSLPVPENPESVARSRRVMPLGRVSHSNRSPSCALPRIRPGRLTSVIEPRT